MRILLATLAIALMLGKAEAGPVFPDPAAIAAAESEIDGAYGALTDVVTGALEWPAVPPASGSQIVCAARPPQVHALLVGAADPYGTSQLYPGTENDVKVIASAIKARTGGKAHIVILTGIAAQLVSLRTAVARLIEAANCRDTIYIHMSVDLNGPANLLPLAKVDSPALKKAFGERVWGPDGQRRLIEDDRPAGERARRIQAFLDTPMFLTLNKGDSSSYQLLTPAEFNSFVVALRNKGANVVASIDTGLASSVDVARYQSAAGDGLWVIEAGHPWKATLLPGRGEFLAMYATVDGSVPEREFSMPDGTSVTYGEFSFNYAAALQDTSIRTGREIAERLLARVGSETTRYDDDSRRFESSNPDVPLFGDASGIEVETTAIQITSPEPTRGVSPVQSSSVKIAGKVNWMVPVVAVLIGGEPAALENGRFELEVNLKTGINSFKIIAVTADNRLLQRTLELHFGGDVEALRGNGTRYAVTIANAGYAPQSGFNPLQTPHADANDIEAALTGQYGYVTKATLPDGSEADLSLRDASLNDILETLYKVSLVAGEEDSVLIYYAGHGVFEDVTGHAFWVPIDAEVGKPWTFIADTAISQSIERIAARKVILFSDSCFSGALMRDGPIDKEVIEAKQRVDSLLALSRGTTRLLVSSGNNEPVTDAGGDGHSIFAQALLDGLLEMPHDQFSARELFDDYIITPVTANAKQEPQFLHLDNVGHQGGDVIFVRSGS